MEEDNIKNIKTEKVCRTCLANDGNFFDISHIFDENSIAQMIRDITDLQVENSDGYTQAICFKCVKEVRRAHKFRRKCIETSNNLIKIEEFLSSKPFKNIPAQSELINIENIKQEVVEYFDVNVFLQNENNESGKLSQSASYYDNYDDNVNEDDDQSTHDDINEGDDIIKTKDISQIKNNSGKEKFPCSECDYSGVTQKALKYHAMSHSKERNYKCELCSLAFKRPSDLSLHKTLKHQIKQSGLHSCTICEKVFFYSTSLTNHMAIHKPNEKKSFVCHICGHASTQKSNLKKHISIMHEPVKVMYNCELCDYSSKQKSQLVTHTKTHTGEKKFKCPHCPFRSNRNHAIKLHVMRHFGQKNFSCDFCDYKCMISYDLEVHKRIHTDEKNFPCTICSYRSRTQTRLNRHMQIHDTELRFACPNCPYRTNTRNCLSRHLKKKCVIKKKGRPSSKP